jgi:hypothetical protein
MAKRLGLSINDSAIWTVFGLVPLPAEVNSCSRDSMVSS